jgi:hypothetical protein
MSAPRSLFSALALGAALALATTPGAAEPIAKWDQARITKYAEELASATDQLENALRGEPAVVNLAQRRAHYEAREDVRLLNNSAKHLVAELKAGKGLDETRGVYRRIASLRRDAEENGRRAVIPEATMDKVFKVGSALFKLAPYYAEGGDAPAPGAQ